MSRSYLVLTAVGPDRPGLVDAISDYVFGRGGNVEASRAATLGGEFAIIMLIGAQADAAEAIAAEIDTLATTTAMSCTVHPTAAPYDGGGIAATIPYTLTVHAMDHPGIVQAVTHELGKLGVNIESLDTHVESAPHTGTAVFHFHARINIPADVSIADCRAEMQAVADRLNVGIQLAAAED